MVVNAAPAGFGSRGWGICEAKLRSQNVPFAFLPVPLGIVRFSEEVMNSAKGMLRIVHTV